MKCKFGLWAALALAGTVEALAQVPVSKPCSPEMSEISACVWTGDCPRGGCANKCIVNRGVTESKFVLLDRSMGEESYGACPLLAEIVSRVLLILRSSGRRLLSDTEAQEVLNQSSLNRAASKRAVDEYSRSGRSMSSLFDANTPASGPSSFSDYADAPLTELLDTVGAPSPASIFTSPITSDVPSNACPLPSDVDEALLGLQLHASLVTEVFTAAASGGTLPADLEDSAYLLSDPNINQFVVKMIKDPERLKQYMTDKCVTETIEAPQSLEYLYWLPNQDGAKLNSDLTMTQCVDNFGAWDAFSRNYVDVLLSCNPPFAAEPDCFTSLGHFMISSPACAIAYSRLFNITDATPLASVAANVNAIQEACTRVTTEEDCLSANTPVLDTIDELHDSIPINHALDIDVIAVAPIATVEPVCFGDDCPPPPADPPTGDEPMSVTFRADPGVPPADAPRQGDGPDDTNSSPPETSVSNDPPDSPPDPPDIAEPNPNVDPESLQASSAFVASCSIAVAAGLLSLVLL